MAVSSEIILRLHYIRQKHKMPEKLALFMENPHGTGSYWNRPNLNISKTVKGQEVQIKTNSYGMHWREVTLQKPVEKKRVVFVGDSFTAGLWATNIENSYVGIFASLLSDKQFEVLNFGVSGYGLADEELLIKEEVIKFLPDYMFLMIFNGNDFRDTYLGINHELVSDGVLMDNPEVYMNKVPSIFIPNEFLINRLQMNTHEIKEMNDHDVNYIMSFKRYLRDHFATYRFLSELKSRYITKPKTITRPSNLAGNINKRNLDKEFQESKMSFTSHLFWSQTPYPDIAVRARDISLETLNRINEYLMRNNIKLVIVTIPYSAQVYADKESSSTYNINLPQKYIETFAYDHNIPYLDLLPRLRAFVRAKNKDIYVTGDIHFNNAGHHIVGELLYEWFIYRLATNENSVY